MPAAVDAEEAALDHDRAVGGDHERELLEVDVVVHLDGSAPAGRDLEVLEALDHKGPTVVEARRRRPARCPRCWG